MRRIPAAQGYVVSLLEAFNFIGSRSNPRSWNESEASAVRLGQKAKADPEARARGGETLRLMRSFAENGTINLIYRDEERRRVPYFQSAGYWLSAIYPDPTGSGEGVIELDDRHLYSCVVDVSQIIDWCPDGEHVSPGPKRGFEPFDEALDAFFENNPITTRAKDVIAALQATFKGEFPGRTTRYARINDAVNRTKAKFAKLTAD